MKEIKLIYIGDRFYRESSTMMSSIYYEDWERCDWGFVRIHLKQGDKVIIAPATSEQLEIAEAMLNRIKERFDLKVKGE